MQARSLTKLQLAAVLAATATAQTVTSTIPVCPTAASTTITIPTTVTFCPGPHCNGGGSGPQITAGPNGVGKPGINVGQYTSVGPGGKTTVLGIWETVYDSLCESGLVPATWTITEPCPCEATPHPTAIPAGFTTTVAECDVCGPRSTITLTVPVATGPYATQTPSVDQANAVASAGANAIANGGNAAGSAGASAYAQVGPNSAAASAVAAADSNRPNGASAQAGANAVAAIQGTRPMNGTATSINGTKPITNAPIQSYVSSASQISSVAFSIFVGITASFLL